MNKLKIAYFGTPYFSARFLEKLLTDISIKHLIEIKLVVTQPDQPVGRKQTMTKSPVKIVAEKFGIEVYDSVKLNSQFVMDKLKTVDIAFLYSLYALITKKMLNLPKMGFWNTHPSLLPKYRGALPITMPLILGDQKTGVTLIKLDEKVDHGPIIAQEKLAIEPSDKKPDLEIKLTDLAFNLFKSVLLNLLQDLDSGVSSFPRMTPKPQNHSQATFTYQLKKEAGFIPLFILKKALKNEPLNFKELPRIIQDYSSKYKLPILQRPSSIGTSSQIIFNLYRGLYPWPGLWTKVELKNQKKRLKITDLTINNNQLTIKSVQLEGKKEVDFKTFNKAYSIF